MPSGAGQRQCRVSVLSFCICVTRFIDKLLPSFSAIYSEGLELEPSIIMCKEIIDALELSCCCWRGQKSAQF